MTTIHPQTLEKDGAGVGWLRLAVGVAAILALVVWGALDGEPSADRSGLQTNEQLAAPKAGPVIDGRGKWSGY